METIREVGRILRLLRLAGGQSRESAAIAAELTVERLRLLESGAARLEYVEALRLAKAYLLCPTCFRREFEAPLDREGAAQPTAVMSTPPDASLGAPVAVRAE